MVGEVLWLERCCGWRGAVFGEELWCCGCGGVVVGEVLWLVRSCGWRGVGVGEELGLVRCCGW